MTTIQTTLGFTFKSPLSLGEMKSRLNAAGPEAWVDGDSHHHGDYVAGRLTDEAVARIYDVGNGFIVNLRFFSKEGDPVAQMAVAKERLLNTVLPTVDARNVTPAPALE